MSIGDICTTIDNIVLQLQPGAAGFQISNPPIFSIMPLVNSLEVTGIFVKFILLLLYRFSKRLQWQTYVVSLVYLLDIWSYWLKRTSVVRQAQRRESRKVIKYIYLLCHWYHMQVMWLLLHQIIYKREVANYHSNSHVHWHRLKNLLLQEEQW